MKLHLLMISVFTFAVSMAIAGNRCTKLYMYGFAASFNDSTVYFTDIQEVDSAWINTKTDFLYSRDNYSYQMRDYLKNIGVPHPTCITVYAKTRKDAEKKYVNLKKRYTTKGNYDVKYLAANDFKFYPIKPAEESQENVITPKKDKKKSRQE